MIASKNFTCPPAHDAGARCGHPDALIDRAALVDGRRQRTAWTLPNLNDEGFSPLWDSTLLDRLNSPLTRYHD
jgi:hypothetical protein